MRLAPPASPPPRPLLPPKRSELCRRGILPRARSSELSGARPSRLSLAPPTGGALKRAARTTSRSHSAILRTMSNQPAVLGPDGVARPYIGGQALIEGVMMRSPHCFSAVVRRKSGALVVREMPMADLRRGKLAWPLVRGVAALVEALKLGSARCAFRPSNSNKTSRRRHGKRRRTKVGSTERRAEHTRAFVFADHCAVDQCPAGLRPGPKSGQERKRWQEALPRRAVRGFRDRHVRGFATGLCGRREQRVRPRAGCAGRTFSAADRRRQAQHFDRLHASSGACRKSTACFSTTARSTNRFTPMSRARRSRWRMRVRRPRCTRAAARPSS